MADELQRLRSPGAEAQWWLVQRGRPSQSLRAQLEADLSSGEFDEYLRRLRLIQQLEHGFSR